MKKTIIKLSYNQGKKVYNNKEIRVSQNGVIVYVYENYDGIIECKDWTGSIRKDITIKNDFKEW